MAQAPAGLRRLLIDYDSTLNPGQGNQPITAERAALLSRYLSRWREAGLQLYVLTSSNPAKKVDGLDAAGLTKYFDEVLSSTMPKCFPSKGDFIASRIKTDGWKPSEQLLADDNVEAIQSLWSDADETRSCALAHSFRLPQHSQQGLVEKDFETIDSLIFKPEPLSDFTHYYAGRHDGEWFLDTEDSAEKCMLDALQAEELKNVLHVNQEMRERWLTGRPDFAALKSSRADKDASSKAAPSAQAVAADKKEDLDKALGAKGQGKRGAPPPPKGGFASPPKDKDASVAEAGPGEGDRVEVTEGPHAGKHGVVHKVTGEGKDRRWRVQLDGDSAVWVEGVKADGGSGATAGAKGGNAPPSPSPATPAVSEKESAAAACGEGSLVLVKDGQYAGRRGRVLKVLRDGEEVRWRVLLEGGGPPTWTEDVSLVPEDDSPKTTGTAPTPSAPVQAEEGSRVEVLSGPHTGRRGVVLKVTGKDEDQRFRVQLDGSSSATWVDEVQVIGGTAAGGTFSPPPRQKAALVMKGFDPLEFLVADSDSEATDAEMPELQEYSR